MIQTNTLVEAQKRRGFKRSLAIVIGINEYQNKIAKLQTARRDAEMLAQILAEEHQYDEVILITDETECKPTLKNLLTLLEERLPKEIQPTKDDRLLFYFAGHGIAADSDKGPVGSLVPQDADLQNNKTLLPMQKLHECLTALSCRHLLVIIDCCFAGTFRWSTARLATVIPTVIRKEHYDRFIKSPAWQAITSAAHNQEALDLLRDNRGGDKHSPFAEALFKALRGEGDVIPAAKNGKSAGDGVITATELYLYLRDNVETASNESQTPGIWTLSRHDRGEYIFLVPGAELKLKPAPKLTEKNNPYRGLQSFEKEHSQLFFGRKELVDELYEKISHASRLLTVVLGVSGSGKSSLVKAGLIPYLRQNHSQKWYILKPMRPSESPFTALARTILQITNNNDIVVSKQLDDLHFLDEILKQKIKTLEVDKEELDIDSESDEIFILEDDLEKYRKFANILNKVNEKANQRLIVDQLDDINILCRNQDENIKLQKAVLDCLNPLSQRLQDPNKFIEIVKTWSQQKPGIRLLLVIDQFEELITLSSKSKEDKQNKQPNSTESEQFLKLLEATLAANLPQLSIVVTLRSDFEPRFLNSEALKSYWTQARFPVRAMRSDELRQAIERPAAEMALYFEQLPKQRNPVDRLIDEVGQMPGALPLLSFTLSELYIKLVKKWETGESRDRALTLDAEFDKEGGVAGSLTRRANQEYDDLPDARHRDTMRRVMLRMVTIEGGESARRRVPSSELVYADKHDPNKRDDEENQRVELVLKRLIEARLVVSGQETGEPYVEPAHDFLVKSWDKLQQWQEKEQELPLVLQRRLTSAANDWEQDNTNTGLLWDDDPRLPLFEQVVKSPDTWLNQQETKFIKRSIRNKEEEDINEKKQIINLFSRASQAFFASNQLLEALIEAVKGGKELQKLRDKLQELKQEAILEENEAAISKEIDIVTHQTVITLEQAVYGIRELNRLEGHTGPVESVCFSRDGQTIASAAWDNTVKLWNRNGKELRTLHQQFKTPEGYSTTVLSVSFSPDSNTIAACGDNTVKLWNRSNGQYITTLTGHSEDINCVCFSPDGQTIASASRDDTVKLWNRDGKELKTLIGHSGDVTSVSFSPDGQMIASASYDDTVKLWKLDGTLITTLEHGGTVYDIGFSPDGRTIASASDDTTVKLWSRDGRKLKTLKGHIQGVNSVSFSPDGRTIASASDDTTVKLWSIEGQEITTLIGHSAKVNSVSFSPVRVASPQGFGQTIASASDDGTVKLWNAYSQERPTLAQRILDAGETEVTKVSFSPDGKIIAGAGKKGVKLWNLQNQEIIKFIQESRVASLSFSPDSRTIAFGCVDNHVKLYNLNNHSLTPFISLSGHTGGIRSISFSPDGEMIASGSDDKTIKLWSRNGQMLKTLAGHSGGVWSVSFSPDGEMIASGSDGSDKTIKLWSRDGQMLKTLTGHINTVNSISFSSDGQIIASGASDNTVKLWSRDGQEIKTLRGHDYQVFDVRFSPDGQMIASADWDGTVKLWNMNGQLLKTLKKRSNKYSWFYSICFSPDGQMIASGTVDGVLLWNFNLDDLVVRGCNWIRDYLKNNRNVEESDRHLCDNVPSTPVNPNK